MASVLLLALGLLNFKFLTSCESIKATAQNIKNVQKTAADNCGIGGNECNKEMRKA